MVRNIVPCSSCHPFLFCLRIWPFQLTEKRGTIWYLSLCDWVLSLCLMTSGFPHNVMCVRISFLCCYCWFFFVCFEGIVGARFGNALLRGYLGTCSSTSTIFPGLSFLLKASENHDPVSSGASIHASIDDNKDFSFLFPVYTN